MRMTSTLAEGNELCMTVARGLGCRRLLIMHPNHVSSDPAKHGTESAQSDVRRLGRLRGH